MTPHSLKGGEIMKCQLCNSEMELDSVEGTYYGEVRNYICTNESCCASYSEGENGEIFLG